MRARGFLLLLSATSACFNPEPPRDTTNVGSTGGGSSSSDGTDTGMPQTDDGSTTVVDTTGDGESGGCADDCNDEIDCTEDACVGGACVNTPMDALCDDGIDCTADACDPRLGCNAAPEDVLCDDGIDCTVDVCDPALGCNAAPDDALCDDGIDCTIDACNPAAGCENGPDDAVCSNGCGPGLCDPMAGCLSSGGTVLVLNGSNGGSTASEDAAASLGYTPIVVTTFPDFDIAFDAGGFGAIIWDVPSIESMIPVSMQMRLDTWVDGGGRLIFGFWALESNPATAATLGVSVVASTDPPLPVHPDPASPVDLFYSLETITPPIVYPDLWGDNGDTLALAGPGFIAGRFNDPSVGPGAILVTHGDRVVTNGFIINEIGQSMVDSDGDGVNDGIELLRNELDLVCSAP